jgi:AcrR family transcriptional regulator
MPTRSPSPASASDGRSTPARRKREAPATRRARILEAAIDLIGERGYYGFTVQELGKRCGLSNPGLLHYFPSKQALMLGLLEELQEREATFMEPLAQMAFEVQDGHRVLSILHAMAERAMVNPRLARVLVALHGEALDPAHPAHRWWREREARTLAFLSRLLEPFVTDALATSRLLLASMDGLFLQWLADRTAVDIAQTWRSALVRLLPELYR